MTVSTSEGDQVPENDNKGSKTNEETESIQTDRTDITGQLQQI